MTTKPKPFSRQGVIPALVSEADAFTTLRYSRQRDIIPRLPELEAEGEKVIPDAQAALVDLFYSLWDDEPGLKSQEQVPADRQYWRQMLEQTIQSGAFQEMHAMTQLKELLSMYGTISMGETIMKYVPKEDQEQLQQLSKAQQDADQLQQDAQQAQTEAQIAQMLAEQAAQQAGQGQGEGQSSDQQSDDQPQPGQGQPSSQSQSSGGQPQGQPSGGTGQMTAEQAREMANQLAQQAANAKAEADIAQQLADEAKAEAQQLAEALMGKPNSQQAAEKQRELARIGMAALKKAQAEVKEISDTVQAWGLDPGELTRESFADLQAILDRVKKNPALKKFAGLLGRMRQIAARKARSKDQGEGVRIAKPEIGRDIKRAIPSELVALTHPALRTQALIRWSRGELRLRGEQLIRKLGEGTFVVCEDASGSMDGLKQQWTKALLLALADYAKIRRRTFGWILFDTKVHREKVYPQGKLSVKERLEISESRARGGTDFEAPLRKAIEMVKKEGLKKADILLITDGMCAVSEEFLEELLTVKKALEITIFVVLVNVGETTDTTVKEFADRIIPISELTAEEAGSKVIALL